MQGELWILLRNMYRNSNVQVKWNNTLSEKFELLQGTKQGSKLSTTLYKCYHNSILNAKKDSGLGAYIGDINVSAPTCADDTALLARNVYELQSMLNIVEFCTGQDLVTINPDKSELLVYGSSALNQAVFLNNQQIQYKKEITHLGVNRNNKNKINTEERMQIARRTIYSLLGPNLHARKGLSPIVAHKMWITYVIPRFLHGAEVLHITKTDLDQLERLQRKICKHIQGLPDRTPSTAVYVLLGVEPLESVIDRNRLSLFMNIARLQGSVEHEVLFRQISMATIDSKSLVACIKNILKKYNLPDIRTLFNNPPSKQNWKKMIQSALDSFWYNAWIMNQRTKTTLKHLKIQQNPHRKPHNIWKSVYPQIQNIRRAEIKSDHRYIYLTRKCS